MKNYLAIILLSITFNSFSQIIRSPDSRFNFVLSSKDLGDHILWSGALIEISSADTLLVVRNRTHDNPKPIPYFDKQSKRLAFQEGDTIKVYDLSAKKIVYSASGLIWFYPENYFDSNQSTLFFLRRLETFSFDLIALDVETIHDRTLGNFITSGDPLTGIPSIIHANFNKKQLTVDYEFEDSKLKKVIQY